MRVESFPLHVQHFRFFHSVQCRWERISPGNFTLSTSHIHPSTSFHFWCTNTAEGDGPSGRRPRESDWGRDVFRSRWSAGQTRTAFFSSSSALNELNEEQVKLTKVNPRDTESSQEVTQHTCGQPQEVDENCFLYWAYACCHHFISPPPSSIFSSLLFFFFCILPFISLYRSSMLYPPLLSIPVTMSSVLFSPPLPPCLYCISMSPSSPFLLIFFHSFTFLFPPLFSSIHFSTPFHNSLLSIALTSPSSSFVSCSL